jgi:hypothetical protein
MKPVVAAIIAALVLAAGTTSTWAGKELQDAVRSGAVIHPHGVWGAQEDGR